MFENSLLQSAARRRAITLGYVVEGLLLGFVVLVPLIHVQALPESLLHSSIIGPPPPAGGPHKPAVARPVRRLSLSEILAVPVRIPTAIAVTKPEPVISGDAFAGPPGAVPWGSANGVPNGFGLNSLPPAPETAAKPPAASRITVGGMVEGARLIFQVKPDYPVLARAAHVQGTVRLEAIISRDGTVNSLHVLSGPPLLIQAAISAVARWRYQPTLLNGKPVEVSTEIDVNFTLDE